MREMKIELTKQYSIIGYVYEIIYIHTLFILYM